MCVGDVAPRQQHQHLSSAVLTVADVMHVTQEALASELAARMNAMNNASDNAKDLKKSLSQVYNRQRQAAITTQLSEICSGANA